MQEGELETAASVCDAAAAEGATEEGAALEVEVCLRGIDVAIAGVAAAVAAVAAVVAVVVVAVMVAAAAWVDSGAGVDAARGGLYAWAQPRVGDSWSSEAWLGHG